MPKQIRAGGLLLVGWAAITLWAHGITVLQPLAELSPSNNGDPDDIAHWTRDLRWAALFAAVAALIALARGNARLSWYIVFGALGWFATDLTLDARALGPHAFVPTAAIGCAVFAAAVVLLEAFPADPGRRALTNVIACCAITGLVVASPESPTDTEPQSAPAWGMVAALLLGVALIGALAAAPTLSTRRLAVALGTGVAAAGTALILGAPLPYPIDLILRVTLASSVFTAVWLLSRGWSGWRTAAGGFAGVAVALPVVVLVSGVFLQGMWVGRLYTAIVAGLIMAALPSWRRKVFGKSTPAAGAPARNRLVKHSPDYAA